MKEYLAYIIAACAFSCATTKPAEENYQVKPVVVKSARDCNNLSPQELIDCLKEEGDIPAYAPAPTTPTYTVTPKVVRTACNPNMSGEEMLECIMEEGDEGSF
ncbi:MAG: hypothetical protein AABY26_04725 [Nanoarchaeota archaeon]